MPNLEGHVLKRRYRIEERLGRGGMGEVYKSWDTWRDYYVAIKVMREDLSEDREFLYRFEQEAQALAQLAHRNIVRFYGFERHELLAFIVMEYVEGTTLSNVIARAQRQPLPLEQVHSVARQVCAALNYAHQEGILHLDIKPGNIFVRSDGQVLLGDFGIAKAVGSQMMLIPGTPAYVSPDECRGERPDMCTEVYSLGILIYEMLAGRRPFRGETQVEGVKRVRERVLWEHMHAVPPPLRGFNIAVTPTLESAVLKALAKTRKDRWPTVLAFWQALDKAMQQGPNATVSSSTSYLPARAVPAHSAATEATSPIFISYSRIDRNYVEKLANDLRQHGFDVWMDDRIDYGARWWQSIDQAILDCGAFVVVMTPDAEKSEWVHREILLAQRLRKPIFPLLLDGSNFSLLIDTQYIDVRDSRMPSAQFHNQLGRVLHSRT